MSRVSVIIPVYNGEQWVGQAIESALQQTASPHEVIVVDDGSTDGTPRVIDRYRGLVRGITQVNQGVSAARNAALRVATGDLIAFLDADDAWHPLKLELQQRALAAAPEIGLLGTQVLASSTDALFQRPSRDALPLTRLSRESLIVKNAFAASSVIVRADIARAVGEFDRTLQGAADHDFWLRAAELTEVARLEMPLTRYRVVPGSMSRHAESMEADMHRVLSKLDARDAWRGSAALRRKAYSYLNFSSAYMFGASGCYGPAIRRMLSSFAWYPLPYRPAEASVPLARPKRLAVLLLRRMGAMRPDPGC